MLLFALLPTCLPPVCTSSSTVCQPPLSSTLDNRDDVREPWEDQCIGKDCRSSCAKFKENIQKHKELRLADHVKCVSSVNTSTPCKKKKLKMDDQVGVSSYSFFDQFEYADDDLDDEDGLGVAKVAKSSKKAHGSQPLITTKAGKAIRFSKVEGKLINPKKKKSSSDSVKLGIPMDGLEDNDKNHKK